MTKHTPEPWVRIPGHPGPVTLKRDYWCIGDANKKGIAFVFGDTDDTARLITAAPETAAERDRLKALCREMLDALRKSNRALSTLADCTDDTYMSQGTFESLLRKNNDAIARAEGKPMTETQSTVVSFTIRGHLYSLKNSRNVIKNRRTGQLIPAKNPKILQFEQDFYSSAPGTASRASLRTSG